MVARVLFHGDVVIGGPLYKANISYYYSFRLNLDVPFSMSEKHSTGRTDRIEQPNVDNVTPYSTTPRDNSHQAMRITHHGRACAQTHSIRPRSLPDDVPYRGCLRGGLRVSQLGPWRHRLSTQLTHSCRYAYNTFWCVLASVLPLSMMPCSYEAFVYRRAISRRCKQNGSVCSLRQGFGDYRLHVWCPRPVVQG